MNGPASTRPGGVIWRLLPGATVPGMVLATVFFCASLAPSLVPRGLLIQSVLSAVSVAAGYGLGVAIAGLGRLLQVPRLPNTGWRIAVGAVCAVVAGYALTLATGWQNGLRALMEMPPVESSRPISLLALTVVLFLVILLVSRGIRNLSRTLARKLQRLLPGPQAAVLGIAVTALLVWNLANGVLVRGAMTVLDASYARLDGAFEEGSPQPTDPLKAGGPGSLLTWEGLGRAGREMVARGPDRARIEALAGTPALEPLRVYVGLNSADDPKARAALALAELLRIGAFDRSTLVIATPTGTGWIDPESQTALEFVLKGDVATVSVQYSYLASWIALLADPEYGVETAREVFAAVYGHWRSLPKDSRPRLYLHGLSLGSLNSDLSHDLFQVIGDPYDGAFWVGPPFASSTWTTVTRARNAGSPAWLPTYRDGSAIRFTSQINHLDEATAPWGGFRIIYLQYASDGVVFFDPNALWRRPDWLVGPRGPDVSPDFIWIPVVTFLQLGVDMMTAVLPPLGHGHSYRFDHYVDGWVALTDAPGWTKEGLEQLKATVLSGG
ncbi:MAG: alpha/beta-hydrolase family protein [Rhodobacterales bacterium]|nr:alpha/beta-hydrolase family protein [Rhodobacterales bacterium]